MKKKCEMCGKEAKGVIVFPPYGKEVYLCGDKDCEKEARLDNLINEVNSDGQDF